MPTIRLPPGAGVSHFRRGVRLDGASVLKWALLASAILCPASQARADYRLHVGDVVEISVARAPELKQRVPVQLDGSISFPMLGNLPIAGLTPSEAQARIQAIMATKVFRQRISDGRENEIMIDHDEVTATVVEYRPVYVNGDVSKPGEYAYRPLMTVPSVDPVAALTFKLGIVDPLRSRPAGRRPSWAASPSDVWSPRSCGLWPALPVSV